MHQTRLLTTSDVTAIAKRVGLDALMDAMIDRLSRKFSEYQAEQYLIPVRSGLHYHAPHDGLIEWMPALENQRSAFVKAVSYHPENPDRYGVPSVSSTGALYDIHTGRLAALIDSTFLTALRTGAASAVASRILAKPDSATVGIIGAGAQAVTQLHALLRCFPVESVLFYDIDERAVKSFSSRISAFLPDGVRVAESTVNDVVRYADILCTCTSLAAGEKPLFEDMLTKPWLHVNAVGADFPGKKELPLSFVRRSLVVPDFREQAEREGECQMLEHAEIGPDIITMLQTNGGNLDGQNRTTIFDSTGYALEDQAAMEMMLELAEAQNIGSMIELVRPPADPINPYDPEISGAEQSRSNRAKYSN